MALNLDRDLAGLTMALTAAGIAEGTNAATIQIAAAIDYVINGTIYEKAITNNIAVTAATTQAVSTSCIYLVQINSAGTVSTVKGTEVATAGLGETTFLYFPHPAADNCPIGAFRVDTDASNTFTAGTTDLSATGITDTYYDLATVPAGALTS